MAAGEKYRYGSEIELELDLSGESDKEPDSHATLPSSGSPGVDINRARIAGSGLQDEELIEVFGPSDLSDEARSEGGNAPMRSPERSNYKERIASGVSSRAGTSQRELDRNVLPHATQVEYPWMLLPKELDRWAGMSTDRDPVPLFDCRRLCSLVPAQKLFVLKKNSLPTCSINIGSTTAPVNATVKP